MRAAIEFEGVALAGDLEVPAGAKGVVLFAHGSGSSRLSPRNQFVAESIRDSGIATLLFDLLTPAEEAQDANTGMYRFDIYLLARRLEAATRWVIDCPGTRNLGVGYFGASTGAAAALVAAANLGMMIDAIVSRGGRPDLADDALDRVRTPTLFIVGQNDQTVLKLNAQAFARLHGEKALEIVPNATHLFEEPGALQEVARLAAAWFNQHLRPRTAQHAQPKRRL